MPTTPQDIDVLLSARSENEHLEFKAAENRFDFEELVNYCVAFANEGGGRIVLGVTNTPPRRVVGTKAFETPERTVTGIYERIGLRVTFNEVNHPTGRVLVFHVPGRQPGLPVNHRGKYLMRVGDAMLPMSPEQLKKIFDESTAEWELRPALTGRSAEDVVVLLDTHGYFDLLGIPYPATREAVIERFQSERLIAKEPEGGWTVTNLGAVLFAKKLESFDRLARKAPRVIAYEGIDKLKTKSDTIGAKGYAVGFQGLIGHINGLVPSNEVIEQALRKEVKMFPEIAIRELVANALIHQDLSETGTSVIVEVYSDRMEISNPGKPFIPPERFIDEYQSRNERLAGLMRRLGVCEEKGSGIDKVVQAAEMFQLPAPDFRVGERRFTAVLFAHIDFDDMDRDDRIRACYQHCCLRYVTNQKMSNQSLRERLGLVEDKSAIVSQIIAAAVEAKVIKLADPNQTSLRYRSYVPFWA
jgi:ATP-dependent DNA helicase RecG